jgi:hypothetical protein
MMPTVVGHNLWYQLCQGEVSPSRLSYEKRVGTGGQTWIDQHTYAKKDKLL